MCSKEYFGPIGGLEASSNNSLPNWPVLDESGLPIDFYHWANTLSTSYWTCRKTHKLNSSQYDETLASILAQLYKLIANLSLNFVRFNFKQSLVSDCA
jgi:hypothetical protein